MSFIEVQDLYFAYPGTLEPVLRGLSFKVEEGSFVAIRGPSGSGKSTLLYLLGAMSAPSRGHLSVGGQDLMHLDLEAAAYFRASQIGFIFQQFHLLPKLSLYENIKLGGRYPLEAPKNEHFISLQTDRLLDQLGLKEHRDKFPNGVSGGQQQRAAIARALMQRPPLILADEPTGNLDSQNSRLVMEELTALNRKGHTIVVITHEEDVAQCADRIITIRDGRVAGDEILRPSLPPIEKQNGISNEKKESLPFEIKSLKYFFKAAWEQLMVNRSRALLTMLGIVIGVGAVMAMLTLGKFAKEKILAGYAEMGVNTFSFRGNRNWNMSTKDIRNTVFKGFSWEKDLAPLKSIFPDIARIAPVMDGNKASVIFGGKSIDQESRTIGVSEESFLISKRKLLMGLPINQYHVKHQSAVCVVGFEVFQRLFSAINPLGQVIFLTNDDQEMPCRIIGVAESLSTRSESRKADLEVYIPYTYYQAKVKSWWRGTIDEVLVEVQDGSSVEAMGNTLKGFFQTKYGKTGRFRADSDAVLVEQMNRFLNIFAGFLVTVAFISLAVGGVGIANMMLVSINDRLREIGLKKALGATNKSLRQTILMESLVICGIAGIIGIFLGVGTYQLIIFAATKLVKSLAYEWVFDPWALGISFTATIFVGLLSGLTPALKAEKLSPIQALRSD